MSFKVQIKDELHKYHWNIILVDTLNEWWEDEHWEIQWLHSQGLKMYIQFLVDPMDGSSIWQVTAKKALMNKDTIIASLSISKRKFNIKLNAFISEIENYRNKCV